MASPQLRRIVALATPKGGPPGPVPASTSFDLSLEARAEARAQRSSVGSVVAVYTLLGAAVVAIGYFTLAGAISGTVYEGWGSIAFGAAVLVGGTFYLLFRLGKNEVIRLDLDRTGFTLVWTKGAQNRYAWNDPDLKVDLNHLEGDPARLVPAGDARRQRPWWLDVWKPRGSTIAVETTLPEAAFHEFKTAAAQGPLGVVTQRAVYFWWQPSPRVPGELHYRAGSDVKPGESTNGEVTRIRGSGLSGASNPLG